MKNKNTLREKSCWVRGEILRVALRNRAGHIAPSLSCVDILVALYYSCMNFRLKNSYWEERDRLIFSKAHGSYGLYAILVDLGMIPKNEWENFYIEGKSELYGCMERKVEFGIEAGCGSLGHGLPLAAGVAFGAKLQKKKYRVFCLIGDGELQEGTNWEALQFAVKHDLGNLIIIVDRNRLQAMDFIINIMDKRNDDLVKRFLGFGLNPLICPGHDPEKLSKVFNLARNNSQNRPKVIVAETIKGFGLKCMENVPKFHYRLPAEKDFRGKKHE